jgi:hypothetical protein
MLFTCAELAKPKRLQGAFVSTTEIERVVSFLRRKGEPDYNMAVTEITKAGTVFDDVDETDPMLEEAIHLVLESGKASTSFLQRRLRLGYARAARIIDLMEQAGVVGPGAGAKPREILVDSWPPGGSNGKEAMPIAQDDYDEAYENDENQNNENEMVSGVQDQTGFTNDGPVDWEDAVDEDWIKQKNENDEMPDDKTDIEE